jgi:hypothetical protein
MMTNEVEWLSCLISIHAPNPTIKRVNKQAVIQFDVGRYVLIALVIS